MKPNMNVWLFCGNNSSIFGLLKSLYKNIDSAIKAQ